MVPNPPSKADIVFASLLRCVKLTNVSSCAEIMKWPLDSEAWSVCWNADDPAQFFVGTKRSKILLFDTREGFSSILNCNTCVFVIVSLGQI